jgi:L-amino acid N-acyltransferase YncA
MPPDPYFDYSIDAMTADDWPQVRAIYLEGIATGNATFENSAPEWTAWDGGHLKTCRLVARLGQEVLGWAALSPVSGRCVYAGVAEVSVYVAAKARGRKIGRALLEALIHGAEENGIWTMQGGIFPENEASIALHLRAGFRIVGKRERLGAMNGRWRDVLLLERRSKVAGI